MRTTLDIDEDVLEAAKEISGRTKLTAGKVLSELARKALTSAEAWQGKPFVVNGFEVLPAGNRVVTDEFVQKLIEDSKNS